MEVDGDMAGPRRLDPVEAMVDQRLARDAHERLRPRRGERPHPLAEPSRHHHRAFDLRAHFAIAFQISARFLSGTLASNHCRTGTSAGRARSEEHTSELTDIMSH